MNLEKILADHALWLNGDGGTRADLSNVSLIGADLSNVDLRSASLRGADLRSACLRSASLRGADLRSASLRYASLSHADLRSADLRSASLIDASLIGASLRGADLRSADLRYASLRYASLIGASLRGADLSHADLRSADLLCVGNMREIKTLQIDTWHVAYTSDTLQIGCQTHPIEKWRKWNTAAGRKWIDAMDNSALAWADKHLDLILQIIDISPGEEAPE